MSELDLLADTVRKIMAATPTGADVAGWSPATWHALEAAGITRIGVPESLGGSGGGRPETAIVLHAAGQEPAPVPLADALGVACWLLAGAGIAVPDGPLTAGGGPNATPDGEGWRLTGLAPRVPWGRHADHVAVLAPAPPDADGCAVVALVGADAYEVTPGENLAGEPRDTLELRGVRISAGRAALVPAAVARQVRARGAAGRVLLMAGAAERTLELTARYATERTQFGRPIARFQAVQHTIARLAAESGALQAAAGTAANAITDEGVDWPSVAAAKVRAGRAAGEIAALAHQVHGAIGFTWEHALRRLTTRLWSWREEYGGDGEWAARLGEWIIRGGPGALDSALGDASGKAPGDASGGTLGGAVGGAPSGAVRP